MLIFKFIVQRGLLICVIIYVNSRWKNGQPGHCAQYCTYTAMENESQEILSIITIDKRETQRNSVIMERGIHPNVGWASD